MALNTRLNRVLREVRRWRNDDAAAPLAVDPGLGPSDLRRLSTEVSAVIETRGGLAAARRRARRLALTYQTLDDDGRGRFFDHLAEHHEHDDDAVDRAMLAVQQAEDPSARRTAEAELRAALRPGHSVLLRRLAGQEGGLAFLVALRADLLKHRRRSEHLRALDDELRQILENWFDVGLLNLVRLTWETPAAFLEKLIEYEAVHAIESWDDLKRRLGPRRRCYAFVHPAMPDDPLIFVEVALTKGIPERLGPLLQPAGWDGEPRVEPDQTDDRSPDDDPDEDRADTAVFYSISNCHRGLGGVSLGEFLIKSVVEEVSTELSNLRTFATLSPLPGFRSWIQALVANADRDVLVPLDGFADHDADSESVDPTAPELWDQIGQMAGGPQPAADDDGLARAQPVLMHLAARYLTSIRPDGRATDPVAHFHLTNGAQIDRLNWLANTTPVGWERGLGMMVNYRYDLRTIEANHDRYVDSQEPALADAIETLLEGRAPESRRRWR